MERTVEAEIGDRLPQIGDVYLRDRLAGLVLQRHADSSVEGAAPGIDVDRRIHGGDFGLQEIFVLFKAAFVVGLNVAPRLRVQIFVEDVTIVEVPGARARGD